MSYECGCGKKAQFSAYLCEEHAEAIKLLNRRREVIATQILASLVSRCVVGNTEEWLVKKSLSLTDALIKELDSEDGGDK